MLENSDFIVFGKSERLDNRKRIFKTFRECWSVKILVS
jgi:hypothetical protein